MPITLAVVAWVCLAIVSLVCWSLAQRNAELNHEIDRANERLDAGFVAAQLPGCNAELETRLRQRESELRDARLEIDHLTELLAQTESDNRELTVRVGVEDAFRRGVVELLARRSNGDLMPQGETVEAGK